MKIDFSKFDKAKLFKSKATIIGLGTAGVILVSLIIVSIFSDKTQELKKISEETKEITIKPTSEIISTDDLWRGAMADTLKKQEENITTKIEEIKKDLSSVEAKAEENSDVKALESRIAALSSEINNLRQTQTDNNLAIKDVPIPRNKTITQYSLNLDNSQNSESYKPIKTADNYIPAGSFAKAVLLSGVDASTALNSVSDPDPVLIRIIDHGNLPRRFKSDLKDCHVIAAAYGDLSSERAKLRLEKLSCTEIATGEIVETEVAGFVTGEDGRQGIRGEVVSTEGKLLGNSLMSGVLGGLANNFNPDTAKGPAAIIKDSWSEPTVGSRLKNSFAAGSSSSLDRLSKYYIERAESLQPVVQVGAGRKVDIIFTEGVFFGTSEVKRELAKKRDEDIRSKSKEMQGSLMRSME